MPTAEKVVEFEAPEVRALSENRLKLIVSSAADVGNVFAAVTPAGTPFEHALKPEFWAHTAHRLRQGDEVRVLTDDDIYSGLLHVRDVSAPAAGRLANRARLSVIYHVNFGALKKDMPEASAEVQWKGPHLKWCIVSALDSRILQEGIGTKEDAFAKLRQIG